MTTWMDLAFTPAVKAVQSRRGSRAAYARREEKGSAATEIDGSLAAFIAETRSFYLATASADGQPYIQHRGGPAGFLRVLDPHTLGIADFAGNKQYISTGNLAENPRAMIFLMDYRTGHRVKIWGRARVVEDDPALIESLIPKAYPVRAEAAILFTVGSWDVNCSQHIPRMLFIEDAAVLAERIRELEAENKRLRASLPDAP